MTQPTAPPPGIPGLQRQVADLERRLLAMETGGGAAPSATAIPVSAAPYSGGDASRLWAGAGIIGAPFSTLYQWWSRMEWTTLDFRLNVALVGSSPAARLQLTCADQALWTSETLDASGIVEGTADLRGVATPTGTGPVGIATNGVGATARFTLDGQIISGGGGAAVYVLPDRLMLTGARFVR